MFQVETTRSVAVHPLEHATSAFTRAAAGAVTENLDTLLGERLLPLRLRQGDEDAPYLLAVDASGQPVVVEIVAVLDEVAVLRALRHAGRAAGMSAQDLAAVYRGGPTRFAAHLAAFRETVPATTLLSTTVRSGARLLLVCSAIADGVQDVVEFLLQPGWQVDILQVGVVPGADGARIVDVYPLTRTPPPRRAMEPSSLRIVRSDEASSPTPGTPGRGSRLSSLPQGLRPDPARRMPSVAPPPFAVRRVTTPAQGVPVAAPATAAPAPAPAPAPRADPGPTPLPEPVWDPVSAGPAARSSSLPYAFTGVAPAPAASGPDARLVAVAAHLGAPAALVWVRERAGESYEALLHDDGWIELPDGSWFADPDAAAEAASAAEGYVDGWSVWRLERPSGPSLRDLSAYADRARGRGAS